MTKQYDLHCHSTASDGEKSPLELVRHAVSHGVEVLALTDHDVTDGLAEAGKEAQLLGIEFISGVEISVSWGKHVLHIVGLNFDPTHLALQSGLAKLRLQRQSRGELIAERLTKAGVENSLQGAMRYSSGQILSRSHFAKYLLDAGYVKNLADAFKRYLGKGKPGFVAGDWVGLEEAVSWITESGGQAVIAHPTRYGLSATKLRVLIDEFKQVGGKGLEVISGSQDHNAMRSMADYARRFDMHASVGSDYHGPSQSWLKMGRLPPLPDDIEPIWSLWADS